MSSAPLLRVARVLRGLGALVLLLGLVAGVPWALWHFIGWPLPHHVPSVAQVGRALDHQGIPAQALVDALAVVVWFTWAVLVASIAAEIPAALSGRHSRRLPFAGAFQPLTGRLVAAVAVACLALAPRAGQPSAPGASGGAIASAMARRPVATLVLTGADLTGASRPVPATAIPTTTPASPAPSSAAPTTATAAQNGPLRTYVVQRGDTLWGIAERELGDPLQWQAIYQLNEGRPQPNGATLTSPHWIDPGWTLLLPAPVTAPASGAAPATPVSPAPPASPSSPSAPATLPSSAPPSSVSPPTAAPATSAPATSVPQTNGATGHPESGGEPVRLPSGSVVAASFAAGVAATVAMGRLRRRHAYRYRPPRPGRTLKSEPAHPTISHLRQAASGAEDGADGAVPVMPVGEEERRQDPGRLDVATRDGEVVTVELTHFSGVALDGSSADDVARALVAALLVRAEPGAAEVLCTTETAERLLPRCPPVQAIWQEATTELVARAVEAERVARSRRFEGVGAADAGQFRAENPEHPLPLLLVLLDDLPGESLGRWAVLVADTPRLGIAVVFLAPAPVATGRLGLDAARRVVDAEPPERFGMLEGAELFGMRGDEAAEVLAALSDAASAGDLDDNAEAAAHRNGELAADDVAVEGSEPWPEPSPPPPGDGTGGEGDRPIAVRMFGHFEVTVRGEPVVTGLRGRARDVFAWCLLRPEGATSDEAVDALWPDTEPARVHGQFWRSFSDLRTRLRQAGGAGLGVFTKVGEHYRPAAAEITCDLWEFQAELGEAAGADDPERARGALRRAVALYRGDLLAGTDRPWVEPVRQDLHRRALDAHLRLAELEDRVGHLDAAVEVLEHAIEVGRYAEEPYRRLMALQAAHGRSDAVAEVWRLLQGRLAELDLDVEPATSALYHQLTAEHPPRDRIGSQR